MLHILTSLYIYNKLKRPFCAFVKKNEHCRRHTFHIVREVHMNTSEVSSTTKQNLTIPNEHYSCIIHLDD